MPPRKNTAAAKATSKNNTTRRTRKQVADAGVAEPEQEEEEEATPSMPATGSQAASSTFIPTGAAGDYRISIADQYFDVDEDIELLPLVPDLHTLPEELTAGTRAKLAEGTSSCWKHDLPLNYGHLPMDEVVKKDGELLRLPWWDMEKDALVFVELKARAPTDMEKKMASNFIGRTHPKVTI